MIGRNRVVITGLGVLAANGIGKEAFWNSLLAGESGIGPITNFDARELPWQCAGEIKNFDPLDFVERRHKPKRESRSSLLSVAAAKLAIEDANANETLLSKSDPVLITMGSTLSGLDLVETHNRRIESNGLNKGLLYVSTCLHIKTASIISSYLGIPTQIGTISNSCSAGLDAIASAAAAIQDGRFEIAIAGGSDAGVIPSVVTGLGYAGLLSTNNNNPAAACRPFDLSRTGGYLGEGAGVVILESLEHALERGAPVYAEVLGYNTTADYEGMECHGYELSMSRALMNANCMPEDISYINAHGSSSVQLDQIETEAINRVFGTHANRIPVTSIKGATGNPLAGGSVMQIVSTVLSFANELIPQTTNLDVPDPLCRVDHIYGAPRRFKADRAMINSRGVGGVNSSMVLKAFN
ncbi:MAG: beta-ketoacyl-[acyl-carrier-protein] synthase family protein [Pontiella sp.]|nr:beta-ketoacyl-[acyl-carrier-protein] synthase family protein [Pontiella sp.]NNJ70399.1 beta-ketoacyl-[acyl-carrier-protein] synthase family protein [Kiritimatiellales bacterium]